MSTNSKASPDVKTDGHTRALAIVRPIVREHLTVSKRIRLDLVRAAFESYKILGDSRELVSGVFKDALLKEGLELKSIRYKNELALVNRVMRIADHHKNAPKLFESMAKSKSFDEIYAEIPTNNTGRPDKKSLKDTLTEDEKEGVANAGTYRESLDKNSKKPSTNSEEEDEGSKSWTDPKVAGKKKTDPWLKECESILTDLPNKFMTMITYLADGEVLTPALMVDLIQAYANDSKDKTIEVVTELLKEDDYALDAARAYVARYPGNEEIADKKAVDILGPVIDAMDETAAEMKRIKATNKKALVGKKRG
jgi:hypothetical protein